MIWHVILADFVDAANVVMLFYFSKKLYYYSANVKLMQTFMHFNECFRINIKELINNFNLQINSSANIKTVRIKLKILKAN